MTTSAFDLPDHLAAKADPALIAGDEQHFAAIAGEPRADDRRPVRPARRRAQGARRHRPGGDGPRPRGAPADRPPAHAAPLRAGPLPRAHRRRRRPRAGVRRTARPHRQHGSPAADRLALPRGRAVLRGDPRATRWVWPAAAGTAGRGGRISDYWDEVFTTDGFDGHAAALDDQSAFIASLGSSRSPRMRDVLGTIQADQDAIIRAGSRGALVVDGGPGTGKTVVALHRTAYLLYSDPRLGHRRGGVLFVGPHQPYLAYVADVLPSLGEEGVQTCTLRDLVPEGADAAAETDPDVARPEVVRGHGAGDRAGGGVLRGAPHRGDVDRDPLVGGLAEQRPTGRRRSGPRTPVRRTTRPATRSGRRCWRSSWTSTRPTRTSRPTGCAARSRRTRTSPAPSTGPGRCSTRPTSSGTCGRCRPTCGCARPGSTPTRCARCGAATPRRGRCPTCRSWTRPGNGSETRRPPGAAVGRRPSPRPTASGWRGWWTT